MMNFLRLLLTYANFHAGNGKKRPRYFHLKIIFVPNFIESDPGLDFELRILARVVMCYQ